MNSIKHDYKGITINQRPQDGYINLNEMAQATNKRVDNWLQNKSTKNLIAEFEKQKNTALITTPTNTKYGGGTWAHPDIAIVFAQWCSRPNFVLMVASWVNEWRDSFNNLMRSDDRSLNKLQQQRSEVEADIDILDAEIKTTQIQLEKKQRELAVVEERIRNNQSNK